MSARRVLVAARGEIAVRIIRALRDMGITSVAVYSKEDASAMHVRLADYRVCIGEGSGRHSYMNISNIITAARNFGCDAVHPGYGFLSENADFAEACRKSGLIFIGPEPETMRRMGNKQEARSMMKAAGVPVVPGSDAPLYDVREAKKTAEAIGWPVMIKAILGGGGKGMRECRSPQRFEQDFSMAQSEAVNAFSDDAMYLEKLVEDPRHVEVQVLADQFGHIITLGDRDCSVQRNHQKLIEESPSPAISDETRKLMYRDAVSAASAAHYTGAGTVEFIIDRDSNYYFLEMNTRIQVEHGVTEMETDTDIVTEQIRIAYGEPLSLRQEDVRIHGHTIECRINAEIPEKGFIPSPGTIRNLHLPGGNGVRVDTALYTGYMVPSEYDSMIAKIIVHAKDRDSAIMKMRTALDETVISGVDTNLDLQYKILHSDAFCSGTADTGFVNRFVMGGTGHEDRL